MWDHHSIEAGMSRYFSLNAFYRWFTGNYCLAGNTMDSVWSWIGDDPMLNVFQDIWMLCWNRYGSTHDVVCFALAVHANGGVQYWSNLRHFVSSFGVQRASVLFIILLSVSKTTLLLDACYQDFGVQK